MSNPHLHVDPRHIVVDAHFDRPWAEPESFHDVMAEQLRRAPWIAVSIVLHAIVFLVLVNIPVARRQEQKAVMLTAAVLDKTEQPIEEPKPKEPEIDPQLKPREVDLVSPALTETETTDVVAEEVEHTSDADFADNNLDTPIGLGGGGSKGFGDGKFRQRGKGGPGRPYSPQLHLALTWLRNHQNAEGHWSSDGFAQHCPAHDLCSGPGNPVNDVGVTGLALLAFLGTGSTMRTGEHQQTIRRGVIWLKDQIGDDGLIGAASGRAYMYNHAIASLALVEAYGLSRYRTLRPYAQKAVDYCQRARNPYKVWRYYPHDGDNDTSVTGWMVFVLSSASYFGLDVDADALKYSLSWLDEVTDPSTGQCGYTKRGEGSSREIELKDKFPSERTESMTAVGLLCRIFLKQMSLGKEAKIDKAEQLWLAAADTMLKKPPVWNPADGSIDLYYWYYGTYAMFQLGGRHWKQWKRHLDKAIVATQRKDGHAAGSWDPISAWGHAGGRVYATAIGALCLEVYERYSPLIR